MKVDKKSRETGTQKIKCVGCGCINEFKYELDSKNRSSSILLVCPYCQAKNTIVIKI